MTGMRLDRLAGLTAMAALSVATATASAQAQPAQDGPQRVVILNAADPYLPAFIQLDRAFREAIGAGVKAPPVLHAETLDMYRFPRAQIDDDVVALLRKKYRGLKVDVVVAVAEIALRFAERHRAEIWPGAAVVFHSVPEAELRGTKLGARTIGVPVRLEFGQTLELALRLRPATRRIVVVTGSAEPDQMNLALARPSLDRRAQGLDVRYLVGLSLADTAAAVHALPADVAVLFLTVFRDNDGTPLVPRNVLTRVAAASRAPVFGVFETYLGDGIVAGSISTYEAQGRRAGELVARVLNGEDPDRIGVQAPAEGGCIADWRQLRRWGIAESLLPADCEVRFRELTAWDRYRGEILAALGVILAQAALIIALVLSRRRLHRVQALAERLRTRLTRYSRERSLGAMATAIAHEINQPLIAIQNYAQAARRRLEGSAEDKPRLLELCAKIQGQAERAGSITQRVRSLVSTSDLQRVRVPVPPLIDEVVRIIQPEAQSRGCRIILEPPVGIPDVIADALQVQLVLVNLLRNAVQSVSSGERYDRRISIDVRPLESREVQVSVTDRGPGVPSERAGEIFEPLASGKAGGMGIGLSVSREIIEAHGGRLWHEANPPGGAVFRFTLQTAGS